VDLVGIDLTYNGLKRALTLTDANDAPNTGVTTNSYDDKGNLLSSLDAENHLTRCWASRCTV